MTIVRTKKEKNEITTGEQNDRTIVRKKKEKNKITTGEQNRKNKTVKRCWVSGKKAENMQ